MPESHATAKKPPKPEMELPAKTTSDSSWYWRSVELTRWTKESSTKISSGLGGPATSSARLLAAKERDAIACSATTLELVGRGDKYTVPDVIGAGIRQARTRVCEQDKRPDNLPGTGMVLVFTRFWFLGLNKKMPKAKPSASAKSAGKSADKSATNVSVGVHASPPSQLSNLASVIAVALAVGVFSVYTVTCYPTLPGGDAGELIYNAHRAGVAHPPGYPIFTMLGYIASHSIPFGSVAWRVNMTSVAYSTGAAVFLYLSILCFLQLRDEKPSIASVSVPFRRARLHPRQSPWCSRRWVLPRRS